VSDGWKKKYIEMFGSFTEPFNCAFDQTRCATDQFVNCAAFDE